MARRKATNVAITYVSNQQIFKYDVHYNNTTIDPPELFAFIRNNFPECQIHYPQKPFLKMMIDKGFPPLRHQRWCCVSLKEYGGEGRLVMTGIRKEESYRRTKRNNFESCAKSYKWFLHPIFDWSELDVWEYIKNNNIQYCKLYDEGWKRIGCLFCPMNYYKNRLRDFERYPKHARAFERVFIKIYEKNKDRESYNRWKSGEEMFWWWLTNEEPFDKERDMPLFA